MRKESDELIKDFEKTKNINETLIFGKTRLRLLAEWNSKNDRKEIKDKLMRINDFKIDQYLIDEYHEVFQLLDKRREKDEIGYFISEYLRVSAGYWGLGTLSLCNHPIEAKKEATLDLLKKSYTSSGGFGGYIGHDPCLRSTHYGMLQLALYDALNDKSIADKDKIAEYVAHRPPSDGSFMGETVFSVDIQIGQASSRVLLEELFHVSSFV